MRITESKLRKMIRSVIKEFTGNVTARGGKKKGYQSDTRKSAQSAYDTKSAEYDTAVGNVDSRKRFRKTVLGKGKKGSSYQYTGGPIAIGQGWSTNPDFTSQVTARDSAETAMDSASTTLDTEKASDLEKTKTPKSQKVQTGGGKGGGDEVGRKRKRGKRKKARDKGSGLK